MLQRAIESAKHAGRDVEIIVVDDASTDETQLICHGMTEIVYLRMERNVGQARARNAGIKKSTAEYIAFLDDDDLRMPKSLDAQADMLVNDEELGFVYGQVHVGDSEACLPTGEVRPHHCPTGDIFWQLVKGNFIYVPSVMVRRRHFEAIGLFASDVLGTEDWDAWLRLAAIYRVEAVREPVAIYRDFSRRSGQTSSYQPNMCKSAARTVAKALRSPRALATNRETLRKIETDCIAALWDILIKEGHSSLSEGGIYYAAMNYITAIRLDPKRAVRLGAITHFTRSILSILR